MSDIYEKLADLQVSFRSPKDKKNEFGGYKYRSAEDMLEIAKPLLKGAAILLSDGIECIEGRWYVKATASYHWAGEQVSVSAYAREPQERKKLDDAQVTGSSSSYARKYALNGLLLADSSELDPDATCDHGAEKPQRKAQRGKAGLSDLCGELVGATDPAWVGHWMDEHPKADGTVAHAFAKAKIKVLGCKTRDEVTEAWRAFKSEHLSGELDGDLTAIAVMWDEVARLRVEAIKDKGGK